MTRDQVFEALDPNKIVGIKFVRVDGTLRTMSARIGVKSHLRGGQKSYDDRDHGLVTVFDMNQNGYRSIKAENILQLTVNGKVVYSREDEDEVPVAT